MKKYLEIVLVFIGVLLSCYGVICLNQLLMKVPLILRMILMIITYWLVAIIPFIICIKNKIKLKELGFENKNILKQIITGIILGLVLSIFFTLIPMLIVGKEKIYSGYTYKYLWQFIYNLFYCIISIGLAEEFIFRGLFLTRLKELNNNSILPIIVSSILFGLFHIFNGNIIQIIVTTFIGIILAFSKEKIKNCTLLSLIIVHGLYDGLIQIIFAIL